ncbi:MAG: hypothetical protein HQL62_08215 [Magnetococcales bacterium]|nr:hypothetical protein [Magnetococcales bacterium]
MLFPPLLFALRPLFFVLDFGGGLFVGRLQCRRVIRRGSRTGLDEGPLAAHLHNDALAAAMGEVLFYGAALNRFFENDPARGLQTQLPILVCGLLGVVSQRILLHCCPG